MEIASTNWGTLEKNKLEGQHDLAWILRWSRHKEDRELLRWDGGVRGPDGLGKMEGKEEKLHGTNRVKGEGLLLNLCTPRRPHPLSSYTRIFPLPILCLVLEGYSSRKESWQHEILLWSTVLSEINLHGYCPLNKGTGNRSSLTKIHLGPQMRHVGRWSPHHVWLPQCSLSIYLFVQPCKTLWRIPASAFRVQLWDQQSQRLHQWTYQMFGANLEQDSWGVTQGCVCRVVQTPLISVNISPSLLLKHVGGLVKWKVWGLLLKFSSKLD